MDDPVPPIYLGRRGSRYAFRIMLHKTVVITVGFLLVDRWWPDPVDGAAVALDSEWIAPPMLIGLGPADLRKLNEDRVGRKREEERSVATPAHEIISYGTVAR